ncbi:MAG: S8 family serine peptidase [Bacteroidales bacterium]|nr:S8 family serine peptidase [Bacteroidales bacterium]
MKRVFIMIMCLISLNLSAQEVMYYIQDNDTISFEVTEDYYVSYNTSVENLIDSGLIRLVSQITDTSAIVSIQNITGSTFLQRKHIVDSMFNNVFSFIEPVLMYEDSTIQLTHNTLMIQAEHDSIVNNVLSGYSYTYDTVNVAGLMNYIITIPNISTMELFVLTTNNNDNKNLIAIEPSFIRLIESCSAVEFDDEYYPNQWALDENHYANINIQKAWEITKGENIRVAVFDTGVQKNHPDLVDNIYGGVDATGHHTGGDIYNEYDRHGTSCAGIIGAKGNNSIGIVGVSYEGLIVPIKMANTIIISGKDYMDITDCRYAFSLVSALNMGVRIFSNSWSSSGSTFKCMKNNINFCINKPFSGKGCVFVFSSGNKSKSKVGFPSSLANVLSVGAIDKDGSCAIFSNYGWNLNLVAPGVGIYTTDRTGNNGYTNSDYDTAFGGTSAACPFVAGVAALVLSVNPNLTQREVRYIIESTCQKIQPETNPTAYVYANIPGHPSGTWSERMGYGLVDAYKAVSLALAMACNTDNSALLNGEITSNTTISTSTIGYGEIIVKSGVTLTVSSNLKMVKASKIIVEPGAKLVVNGGEIVGACGEYWDGIRLEGNKNLSQTEANQGVVELNNALISDARDAISVIGENSDWNKTGGIIKATNTTFKNNRRSIEFMSYGEGSNANNVSYFRNCTFTWDDDLLANESTVQSHITMYQVKGVDFKGCTFKDERTSTTGLTTHGILTNQAGYIINKYLLIPGHGGTTAVYKNTSFENLTYGIRTEEADDKLCKIQNSVFDDNDKGIYVTNTDNLYVVNNTFNVKSMAHGMGLAAQNSTNFTIQKNDFLGTSNTYATAGLQIMSSGEDNNLVKQNRFVNLYAGFQALGVNYGINTGLELNCNSFSYCQRGIDIHAFPLNNATGIKSVQGSQSLSAGNKFTNNTNNVINNGVNTITYYYYGTQENPNYFSMKFLPIQASSGASCGLIGNITGPNFPLLSNGDGEENEEEESIETSSIAPTTVLSYINKKDYLSAESLLSASDMSQEEKNDYRLYSSYIQEYGNSYNIPIDMLLDLSGKENNIGLVAKQMLYFKGVEADLHPKVIVEQPQDSDTTAINNKMKSVKVLNGLSQNDEYTLSPNPANSEVVVKGTKAIREITILDLQGKELKTFYNTEKFNISFLKNGTYIIRIKDSENKVHYQKLIKQ